MPRSVRSFACVLALCLGASGSAAFADSLSIVPQSSSSTIGVTYSPDATAQVSGRVTIMKNDFTSGKFHVVFDLVSMTKTKPTVTYALYAPTANDNQLALSAFPQSSSEVLSGQFNNSDSPTCTIGFDFVFLVLPTTMPRPGVYTAIINELVYDKSYAAGGRLVAQAGLTVNVTVPSIYQTSVVPTGENFSSNSTSQTLDFGVLTPGNSLGADMLVRSNVNCSVEFASAHKGSLVNIEEFAIDPQSASSIGYALTYNNRSMPLAAGPFTISRRPTYTNPARYRLRATILPISGNPTAGGYADTITITMSAQ